MNELFTPEFVQLCMSSIVYVQIFRLLTCVVILENLSSKMMIISIWQPTEILKFANL